MEVPTWLIRPHGVGPNEAFLNELELLLFLKKLGSGDKLGEQS
jgi:hypothetical protein